MTILVIFALLIIMLYSLALRSGFKWEDLRPSSYSNNPDLAPMNKITRSAFNLFKFSSLGFIFIYILIVIIVGGAGHSAGDSASFFCVTAYSVLLFFLIHYFQKLAISRKQIGLMMKVFFVILVLPAIIVSILFLFASLQQEIESEMIFSCVILIPFAISGLIVLKHILFSHKKF